MDQISINKPLENLGKQIGEAIPKKEKATIKPVSNPDPLVEKFRKWLLIGLSSIVAGVAVILVIASVIRKVF